MLFETRRISSKPDAIALDGSEVRVLCGLSRGSLSVFTLRAHTVSRAVAHRAIEEVWYVVAGTGQMWRRLGDQEEIVAMQPGVSLSIPTGTHFQFRCDGEQPLTIVAAVMPPWPGDQEVYEVRDGGRLRSDGSRVQRTVPGHQRVPRVGAGAAR